MQPPRSLLSRILIITCTFVLTTASITTMASPAYSSIEAEMRAIAEEINFALDQSGEEYRIGQVDYLTSSSANEVGRSIFFGDTGNKQLGSHWVRGDARRGGFNDIAYLVDGVDAAPGLPIASTIAAIDRAMATWDNVRCSDITLFDLGVAPFDVGFAQFLISGGVSGLAFPLFDITHGGWIPLPPGVLGVTFTFDFVGGDSNNDGREDTAFREIYYNSDVPWGIDTSFPFDVETVALHEAGHALSQDHFGKLFQTDANGKFHFAPRALMNAGYTGVQQEVSATDNAGHCGIWGSWGN